MRMKGEEQGEATGASSSPAVISVLDRNAGIFRGREARLSRVRALRAPPQAPLTAAPRPQDGRRAIKDGPCVDGQAALDHSQTASNGLVTKRRAAGFTLIEVLV